MARTNGHGNPNWTRDETILALDLYFDCGERAPSGNDERVRAVSDLLRQIPYHAVASRKESFRNPDGVAFKLQNLRQISTGKGLGNVSEMDRNVWRDLGANPQKTKELATLIRSGILASSGSVSFSDEVEFSEGRVVTELHTRRERNPKLRQRLIAARRVSDKFFCEMCGCPPLSNSPIFQDAQFEAHHIVPLSHVQTAVTRLADLALVCASCHRLLHRAIAAERRWLTIAEGKKICMLTMHR
jgi:5-methylcytosine-specific restriction protein A